jgi:hypothetical protein
VRLLTPELAFNYPLSRERATSRGFFILDQVCCFSIGVTPAQAAKEFAAFLFTSETLSKNWEICDDLKQRFKFTSFPG